MTEEQILALKHRRSADPHISALALLEKDEKENRQTYKNGSMKSSFCARLPCHAGQRASFSLPHHLVPKKSRLCRIELASKGKRKGFQPCCVNARNEIKPLSVIDKAPPHQNQRGAMVPGNKQAQLDAESFFNAH
jgi:hypothetical protein